MTDTLGYQNMMYHGTDTLSKIINMILWIDSTCVGFGFPYTPPPVPAGVTPFDYSCLLRRQSRIYLGPVFGAKALRYDEGKSTEFRYGFNNRLGS